MTEVALYEAAQAPSLAAAPLPERVGVPGSQDFDSWTAVVVQVVKLADHICDTAFVPDGLRGSAPAVAAAMLAGREMGLGPMTSLANVDVIRGRPALKPVLMRALIQSRGHKWVDVDVSDSRVVIRGCRRGEAEWTEVTFTVAQAKTAGIDLGKYPADKLYARASSRLAKRKFADVIMGMPYSADELEDGDDPGITEHAPAAIEQPAPATPPRTAQRRQRKAAEPVPTPAPAAAGTAPTSARTPAADGLPPLPGEDEPDPTSARGAASESPATDRSAQPATQTSGDRAPAMASSGQVGIIQSHFVRLGMGGDLEKERNARLIAIAIIAGRDGPVGSSKELTQTEASVVADTLSRCRDRDRLVALLSQGEKPEAGNA